MTNRDNKADRPFIRMASTSTNRMLDWSALTLLGAIALLAFYYFNKLPDTIPTHFNHLGLAYCIVLPL